MSLINDALRRAKQVQEQAPAPPPPPPLNPVDPVPTMLHGLGILVPVVLTIVALIGLLLLWQLYQRNNSMRIAEPVASQPVKSTVPTQPSTTAVALNTAAPLASAPNPIGANASAPATAPGTAAVGVATSANVAPPVAGNAVATATTNGIPSPAAAAGTNLTTAPQPEMPKPATLTLQGIAFNPRRPSVIINGRTLFLGDRIGQFRVAAIHPDSTVLVGGGRTNLLSLDQ